jgi:hypothetical protein
LNCDAVSVSTMKRAERNYSSSSSSGTSTYGSSSLPMECGI